MNKTDSAIVVRISCYGNPDFSDFGASANDTRALVDLLVSPDGGRRKLTEFKPPFPSPSDVLPGVAEVQRAFDRRHDIANENVRMRIGHLPIEAWLCAVGYGSGCIYEQRNARWRRIAAQSGVLHAPSGP